jgi:hypothetical protein
MIRELYQFDWNITDSKIQQQQKTRNKKLERMWRRESDETFSSWGNLTIALISTHQIFSDNVLWEIFLVGRQLVKITSKLIFVWIAPKLADQISKWGEEERGPWSFALIYEEFITR